MLHIKITKANHTCGNLNIQPCKLKICTVQMLSVKKHPHNNVLMYEHTKTLCSVLTIALLSRYL